MSIVRNASIFVGIPTDKVSFKGSFSLVEDFFIPIDPICGGDEFYGKELMLSIEDGITYLLNQNVFDELQNRFKIAKQELIETFNQIGFEFNADDIRLYFAIRCL